MESTRQTETMGSLLDEADFLAELATVEDGIAPKAPIYRSPSATLEPIKMRPHRKFADSHEPTSVEGADDGSSVLEQIAAAAMFVLMMAVGAAGAAVVFHERVARILAAW